MDADVFIDYPYELFSFMRETHKPVFHNSNIFLRDLQYAIQDYYEDRYGETVRNDRAEVLAREVAKAYELKGIFRRVNPQGYLLNYPELTTAKDGTKGGLWGGMAAALPPPAAAPAAKPAAAAKPAPAAPAAAAPATPAAKPAPAGAGAAPAGAKAPPPWLKK